VRDRKGARQALRADHVLLALPASGMLRLARSAKADPAALRLLRDVRAQSFLYAYARLPGSAPPPPSVPDTYTVLAGSALQKAIPMGGRVYMIAYADNERARRLRREGCPGVLRRAEKVLGARFTDCALRWNAEGTHYFAPLPEGFASRRDFLAALRGGLPEGLHVAGEALSDGHQGWVEGALRDAGQAVRDILEGRR